MTKKNQGRLGQGSTDDKYCDDSSYGWLGIDKNYADVPDVLSGTDDERLSTDTLTLRTLTISEDDTYTVDENSGADSVIIRTLGIEEEDDDTVPIRRINFADDAALTIDDVAGADPYNTSRMNIAKF